MIITADLHVHSKYSMATSKNMIPTIMAKESSKKGLNLIATGDALHSKWLNTLEENLQEKEYTGIYELKHQENNYTNFLITTEVEDNQRIHHLILIPSIETAWQMREEFTVKNMDADGRPKLRMNASEIMDITQEYDCLIGPAHIFTPWTGIYKQYDSITDCYTRKPDFVELGLSSDTYLADTIRELKDYTFLTNSDSHSPWPHRIGREFNKIEIKKLSFKELQKSIRKGKIIENYGINPKMGKYHETGCIKCYKSYTIEKASEQNMKCTCGGQIKKGVLSRIRELSTYEQPIHPENRPHYQYILPLSELLSMVHDKGITTKYVQTRYDNLIKKFGTEINILLDTDIEQIRKTDPSLAKVIKSYRDNTIQITAGRGGQYGKIKII
ncbi:MAG: TIGR00375 family protein [Methanosphaera sp.]|nr:TIGR00375 family protein [Methanosphaera sp.]